MIYQEKLTSFDPRSLSAGKGLTDDDLKKINAHFGLDSMSADDLVNFGDFAAIWFFSLTKNLEGRFLDEKLNALDKISLAINVTKTGHR